MKNNATNRRGTNAGRVTNKCERHGQTKEEMESSLRDLLFLLPRLYIGETGENLTTRLTGHKRMTRKGAIKEKDSFTTSEIISGSP